MPRKTRVRTTKEGAASIWTIQTHESGGEWWSELLDPHRHPRVATDAFGFDTVIKYWGDSPRESVDAAVQALRELLEPEGGSVEAVDEPDER